MKRNRLRAAIMLALLASPMLLWAVYGAIGASAQSNVAGIAQLKDKEGNSVGQATFTEESNGVHVTVRLNGVVVTETAEHGIHIHQTAKCEEPDFESAGEHFNPTAMGHGKNNPDGPHAGDLPNITINSDGTATYEATDTMVTLSDGERSVFDTDGSSLIIHENPDDYMTDPSGKSGGRMVCGVIEQSSLQIVGMPRTGSGHFVQWEVLYWIASVSVAITLVGVALYAMSNRKKDTATIPIEEMEK